MYFYIYKTDLHKNKLVSVWPTASCIGVVWAAQVWIKPLSDGTFAVALINKDEATSHNMVLKLSGNTDGERQSSVGNTCVVYSKGRVCTSVLARTLIILLVAANYGQCLQVTFSVAPWTLARPAFATFMRSATLGTLPTCSMRRSHQWTRCC